MVNKTIRWMEEQHTDRTEALIAFPNPIEQNRFHSLFLRRRQLGASFPHNLHPSPKEMISPPRPTNKQLLFVLLSNKLCALLLYIYYLLVK